MRIETMLFAFLTGVFGMAGLGYWLWKTAGSPPSDP